jgi:hypothetical protein
MSLRPSSAAWDSGVRPPVSRMLVLRLSTNSKSLVIALLPLIIT